MSSLGLTDGECTFNVPLFSAELGLSVILDMLIETETELFPVDHKQSKKIGKHVKLQLMAYGRLLELTQPSGKPVQHGFLYLIPQRKATAVPFTRPLGRELEHTMTALHPIIWQQQMPPPPSSAAPCVDCEFRRFCNDVF